jgi:hypothetical protein
VHVDGEPLKLGHPKASLAAGGPLLGLPAYWIVWLVEAALMVSIAVPLALLFAGGASLARPR